MKVLNVVQSAYRTLVEEQDDTILWLSQTLQKAGADLSVLLSGHACFYAFQQKPLPVLQIGSWRQSTPTCVHDDLQRLQASGVPVYVVAEDLSERGLQASDAHPGVQTIPRSQVASLYEDVDLVWHW